MDMSCKEPKILYRFLTVRYSLSHSTESSSLQIKKKHRQTHIHNSICREDWNNHAFEQTSSEFNERTPTGFFLLLSLCTIYGERTRINMRQRNCGKRK